MDQVARHHQFLEQHPEVRTRHNPEACQWEASWQSGQDSRNIAFFELRHLLDALERELNPCPAATSCLRPWEQPGCALDMWTRAVQPLLTDSLQESRRQAAGVLQRWRVPQPVLTDALIATGELVANAVKFGRRSGTPGPAEARLTLWRMDMRFLVIEVFDQSPTLPRQRPAGPDAVSGRGLNIVDALSSRWGSYVPLPGWKCVYCLLEISQ